MRHRSALVFFICLSACQSKPARETANIAAGKATLKGAPSALLIELESSVAYAPRRTSELESAVLLEPGIQQCLRAEFKAKPTEKEDSFGVELDGKVTYRGEIEDLKVSSSSLSLKLCLEKEIPSLKLGRGHSGRFKMQISRAHPHAGKAKTFLLDLNQTLKFE